MYCVVSPVFVVLLLEVPVQSIFSDINIFSDFFMFVSSSQAGCVFLIVKLFVSMALDTRDRSRCNFADEPLCMYHLFVNRRFIQRLRYTRKYAVLCFGFHFIKAPVSSPLTFQSLAVSLRTTRFNIQKFYMALALRCVFCTNIRTDSDICFIRH